MLLKKNYEASQLEREYESLFEEFLDMEADCVTYSLLIKLQYLK